MSNTVPKQPSPGEAARSDAPSAHPTARPVPDFEPHSPIEREIERSERASAALAATRALARAAFTDSQLAADDAAADGDVDASGWARTEYAALGHSVAARPQGDVPAGQRCAGPQHGRRQLQSRHRVSERAPVHGRLHRALVDQDARRR